MPTTHLVKRVKASGAISSSTTSSDRTSHSATKRPTRCCRTNGGVPSTVERANSVLLVAQGLDGIEPCRASGGKEAEANADAAREGHGDKHHAGQESKRKVECAVG